MGHMFVVTPLIYMMVIFLLEPTPIPINCNYGTLVHVSQLKTSLGTKVFLQKKLAKFTELNSKRTPEILSLLEVVVLMKLKFLMETICSNHVLKSKILVELHSL